MKKVGIVTLNGNSNYGNKLQNYALKKVIEKKNYEVETIWFNDEYSVIKTEIKTLFPLKKSFLRESKFEKFTKKYLNRSFFKDTTNNYYDFFVVGSDQVWNYNFKAVKNHIDRYFLLFSQKNKNIAYAASIGVNKITDKFAGIFEKGINNLNYVSVREQRAKDILSERILNKKIDVVLDPTMLLNATEWDKIIKKPRQLKNKKFILNYFLGELSESRKKEIEKIAKENNCHIINILDKKDPFYTCGPSEFLYLEKNAFLICTDSFHSSVFAILFNTSFIVFDREEKNVENMNSRIDTLLSKFKLEDRRFNGNKITKENLKHDYTEAYKILEKERKKSEEFLKKALEIE